MSFLWYLSIFSKIWLNITSHSSLLRKLRERVCHPNVTKLLFCSLSFKWSRKSSPWYLLRKPSFKIFWTTVSTRRIKTKKIRIDSDQSTSINKIRPPFNKLQKILSTKFIRTFYLQGPQKQKNVFRSKIFGVFTKTPVLICQCKYNISSNIMNNLLVLISKFYFNFLVFFSHFIVVVLKYFTDYPHQYIKSQTLNYTLFIVLKLPDVIFEYLLK